MSQVIEKSEGFTLFTDSRSPFIQVRGKLNGKYFKFSSGAKNVEQARRIVFKYLINTAKNG